MTFVEVKLEVKKVVEDLMADMVEWVIGGQVLDLQVMFVEEVIYS